VPAGAKPTIVRNTYTEFFEAKDMSRRGSVAARLAIAGNSRSRRRVAWSAARNEGHFRRPQPGNSGENGGGFGKMYRSCVFAECPAGRKRTGIISHRLPKIVYMRQPQTGAEEIKAVKQATARPGTAFGY
jgi:hypothetical protein